MKFSSETTIKVFDNEDGYYYSVSQDGDSLSMVELTYADSPKDKPRSFITMDPAAARLVAAAIIKIADEIEKEKK